MSDPGTESIPTCPSDLGLPAPSIIGSIKAQAEDFVVSELPGYETSGQGEFLYLQIRRSNLNTKDVAQKLARAFSMSEAEVGYAGLKDKNAITTQQFSIPLIRIPVSPGPEESLSQLEEDLMKRWPELLEPELELLQVQRHTNGLRRGHLQGNQFSIRIRNLALAAQAQQRKGNDPPVLYSAGDSAGQSSLKKPLKESDGGSGDSIREILETCSSHWLRSGFINLYGTQRFGKEGSTLHQGLAFMDGKKARKWLLDLGVSAVQSYVFNHYLRLRNEKGQLFHLMNGDLAVKANSGGIFKVPVAAEEEARFQSGEICYTGPMFGKKLRSPEGPSLALEQEALSYAGRTEEDFKKMKVPGARRAGLIFLRDLRLEWPGDDSVWMDFTLPAGSYATVAISHMIQLEENSERSL
ncbi:MAG: hypothetical protein CMF59_11245 [Leptospiraceae bacterium]|nr:hypothetical protein [Leptospiraceae bacterium]